MITELVVIDGYYAIRKTERKLLVFKTYRFLNLSSSDIEWKERSNRWFSACLTLDISKAKKKLAWHGSNMGVPYEGDVITVPEMMSMIKLAQTNEGLKDLLLKAKEFYLLLK